MNTLNNQTTANNNNCAAFNNDISTAANNDNTTAAYSNNECRVIHAFISKCEAETVRAGEELAAGLTAGSVIALRGGLGAGKTAFTRGIAAGLGLKTAVSSPTFTIVNEYLGDIPLFHFDMYRLESEDELFDIGWDEYLERGGICVVEWSEKVAAAIPLNAIIVSIENLGGDMRRIEISGERRCIEINRKGSSDIC